MYRDGEDNQARTKATDDLVPYRYLVKLQKEMIELSQKHEHSKREHAVLRKQVAREVDRLVRRRGSFSHRLRRTTAKFITRLPGFTVIPIALKAINSKSA